MTRARACDKVNGTVMLASCPACQEANPATAKFCGACGRLLVADPSYTPSYLNDTILNSPAAVEAS